MVLPAVLIEIPLVPTRLDVAGPEIIKPEFDEFPTLIAPAPAKLRVLASHVDDDDCPVVLLRA